MKTNIEQILKNSKTIAVVGASPKPNRESGRIFQYLISVGYKVFPVNPLYEEVYGEKCYKNLSEIPDEIDIVNIFRKSEEIPPIVNEAINKKAKIIWMQLGIVNSEAEKIALDADLSVVMDKCIYIEHKKLF